MDHMNISMFLGLVQAQCIHSTSYYPQRAVERIVQIWKKKRHHVSQSELLKEIYVKMSQDRLHIKLMEECDTAFSMRVPCHWQPNSCRLHRQHPAGSRRMKNSISNKEKKSRQSRESKQGQCCTSCTKPLDIHQIEIW